MGHLRILETLVLITKILKCNHEPHKLMTQLRANYSNNNVQPTCVGYKHLTIQNQLYGTI